MFRQLWFLLTNPNEVQETLNTMKMEIQIVKALQAKIDARSDRVFNYANQLEQIALSNLTLEERILAVDRLSFNKRERNSNG